jgi:hypothetical protein
MALAKLPTSTAIVPRPVWKRWLRRSLMNVNAMPPPTEAEKADAIRVLSIPAEEQWVWGLWFEAQRILDEA